MKGYGEWAFMDAMALAEQVRKKTVTAAELVEAAIETIEALNPQLNAVVTPMYDEARRLAREPLPDGPFAGVPMLLKDLLAFCKGVPISFGTKNLAQLAPDHDSELVSRYRKAGFIFVGKTNTPELGLLPTTEPHLFGPCRNPWDMTRTTGGSSGGSAAAVASGMVPVAHGNDGGGSIRIPSSCCGLFGLKPTRGRNPLGPDFGDIMSGLVAEHVLTRSVRDSAAVLDATQGPGLGDPYWAPPPARPFLQEVGAPPGRLRIALLVDPPNGAPLAEDCRLALEASAKLCAELGHEVVEAKPVFSADAVVRAFTVIWAAGCASTITGIAMGTGRKPTPDQYETITWGLYEMGIKTSGADYLFAVQTLQRMARDVASFFLDYDVLMTPTLAEPPVPLGTFDSPPEDPLKGWRRSGSYVPFTPLCNATGQPAMSVPLYWNAAGLPVGTHFVGRFGDEATLLRLASQLEEARPWQDRRPPVRT
jgi:amidase